MKDDAWQTLTDHNFVLRWAKKVDTFTPKKCQKFLNSHSEQIMRHKMCFWKCRSGEATYQGQQRSKAWRQEELYTVGYKMTHSSVSMLTTKVQYSRIILDYQYNFLHTTYNDNQLTVKVTDYLFTVVFSFNCFLLCTICFVLHPHHNLVNKYIDNYTNTTQLLYNCTARMQSNNFVS